MQNKGGAADGVGDASALPDSLLALRRSRRAFCKPCCPGVERAGAQACAVQRKRGKSHTARDHQLRACCPVADQGGPEPTARATAPAMAQDAEQQPEQQQEQQQQDGGKKKGKVRALHLPGGVCVAFGERGPGALVLSLPATHATCEPASAAPQGQALGP